MIERWLTTTWTEAGLVLVSGAAILTAVIAVVRIVGLRSFSKMSSFDFAVTVAIGSIMATVTASATSLANGVLALVALLGAQWIVAQLRLRGGGFSRAVDNDPLLLMDGDGFREDNLRAARVTQDDVLAKLREANVTDPDQVLAVVLETTGDVSVLHGDGPLHRSLLQGVRGAGEDRGG